MPQKKRSCIQTQKKLEKIFALYAALANKWIQDRQKLLKKMKSTEDVFDDPPRKIAERFIRQEENILRFERIIFWDIKLKEAVAFLIPSDFTCARSGGNFSYFLGVHGSARKEISTSSSLTSLTSAGEAVSEINGEHFDAALDLIRRKERLARISDLITRSKKKLINQIFWLAQKTKTQSSYLTVVVEDKIYHFGSFIAIRNLHESSFLKISENDEIQEMKLTCG